MIRIAKTGLAAEREPLLSPFGFKGGYISELWQSVALLQSDSGRSAIGLGVQSVLWSDPNVFHASGQDGDSMMLDITRHALSRLEGTTFDDPMEMLEGILEPVYGYGKTMTGRADLRETFALNALVPVDHAAWLLYSRERGLSGFDEMVPAEYRDVLAARHRELASTPVVSYGHSEQDIVNMLDEGYFLLKIKLGSDPDKDGDLEKMLKWDQERIALVHRLAAERTTPYTDSGKVLYYLDANGRYDSKDRLLRLLEHADRVGALERTVLLEEPFPESYKVPVDDVPVRVAADESVHNERDAVERIGLGYGAITLKPVAKTLSVTLKVAKEAHKRGVPCFCADLTANPWMVDWNKNLAARLSPVPGLKVGIIETNGHQNYANWERMKTYHPYGDAVWVEAQGGIFRLDDAFYAHSGGVYGRSEHYEALVGL